MKTTEFKGIKTILTKYISQSAEITKSLIVDDHITFDHLTIGQVKELITKARALQSKTDTFLKDELYHIIGMGNLSASQTAALNKLVRGITEHRTLVKALASFPPLPNKPSDTQTYKLSNFGLQLKDKLY